MIRVVLSYHVVILPSGHLSLIISLPRKSYFLISRKSLRLVPKEIIRVSSFQ